MKEKPNILYIFTDMQRADTIAALGNPVIRTPNLDRLVREGTAFTNAFTPSPVCCSARCSMHYGLYTGKTGLADNGLWMEDNGLSYPELLSRSGYETHGIGKCHFVPDLPGEMRGFDHRISQEECCSDPQSDDYMAWLAERGLDHDEPHGARGEMYYIPQISRHDGPNHPTTWIADRTMEVMEAKAEKPWMIFSSIIHPHPPFALPKPWHKLYRPFDMPLPRVSDQPEALWTFINRIQNRYKWRDQGMDLNLIRTIKAYYYACISHIDFQIGRMLEVLERTGQLDDTLIVFSSDHGEHLGDQNCFGKRSMHDAAANVPLLVRYPDRFPADHRCETPVSLVDILPTFCTAAGVDLDGVDHDGVDLAEVAQGNLEHRTVFSHFGGGADPENKESHGIYMAVDGQNKYVYSSGDGRSWLFDRRRDPEETRNIANLPGSGPRLEAMEKLTQAFFWGQGVQNHLKKKKGGWTWKEVPPFDTTWLDQDPDAGLLLQDHMAEPLNLPGYSDA